MSTATARPTVPCKLVYETKQHDSLSAALTAHWPKENAVGQIIAAQGAAWVRWNGGTISAHAGQVSDGYSARFFIQSERNRGRELRWQQHPGQTSGQTSGTAVIVSLHTAADDANAEALATEFLLEGTMAKTESRFVRLSGGASDKLWLPFDNYAPGKRLAITALEIIERGPQGNAQIVDTIWTDIKVADAPLLLPGQKPKLESQFGAAQ